MGYVENLQAEAQQAADAQAFRNMQSQAKKKAIASDAFSAGVHTGVNKVLNQYAESPQAQRESNLYGQQQMDAQAAAELADKRSLLDKGIDGLAGMFHSEPSVDDRVRGIQQMQHDNGQPVMGTKYLSDWLIQQDKNRGY